MLRRRGAATSAGPGAIALRRLRRDRAALAFGVLFALLMLAFFSAPLYASRVAGTTPADNHLTDQVTIDGERKYVVSPDGEPIGPTWGSEFFLGADENGRDLMVRLLYGGRTSLLIGAGALALTVFLAVPLALVAGYFRGRTDSLISRLLDVIWSFPALLLGVLLGTAITLYGAQIGPFSIEAGSKLIPVTVIGLVYVPYIARPLRGEVLALREQRFVEAALACGLGPLRVMFSELLPHLWTTVLVLAPLRDSSVRVAKDHAGTVSVIGRNPADAGARGHFTYAVDYPSIAVRATGRMHLTSDAATFQVGISLDVDVDRERVFSKVWRDTVPRALM